MAAQQMMMMRQQQMMMQQMAMMNPMAAFMNPMAMMGQMAANMAQNNEQQQERPTKLADLDPESEDTHRILAQQAYAHAMSAANFDGDSRRLSRDEEDDDDPLDDTPPGPSSNVHHPHYRPPDMEPVLGLTDRRFEGHIEKWFDDTGFGFIECDEITKKFGRDAFLHRTRRKHFKRGDPVSFAVFLDYRGKPQATELRKSKRTHAELQRAQAAKAAAREQQRLQEAGGS